MKIAGMTLIELMVTVAILAILASIAIPAYNGYISTAYRTECQNEVAAINLAEEESYLQTTTYKAGVMNATTSSYTLETALAGLYKPDNKTKTSGSNGANCTYSATLNGTTGYTVTATGINHLSGTIITFTK